MKLIYMEITHNTDDSVRDLSSLDEGGELRKRKKKEWDSDFFPCCLSTSLLYSVSLLLRHTLQRSRSSMFGLGIRLSVCMCVCDGERVCELLSLCWPCRAPACLSGSHWSIMLSDCPEKTHYSETSQHISSEVQVSLFCVELIPHHPWMQMSCLQCPSSQMHNSGAKVEVPLLKYTFIFE